MPRSAFPNSNDRSPSPPPMRVLRGLAVSPGIAIGPVVVVDRRGFRLPPRNIEEASVAVEIGRLEQGLEAAGHEAEIAETDARDRLGPQYADILAAHARMIADPTLLTDAQRRIERSDLGGARRGRGSRVPCLPPRTAQRFLPRGPRRRRPRHRVPDPLPVDGQATKPVSDELSAPALILAQDLSPSEAAGLDPERILGFATEGGGQASHTAIVAAALELPAVVGLGKFLDTAEAIRTAIIDGDEGLLILDPDTATRERYKAFASERSARFRVLSQQADLPAETLDAEQVQLWGNIEFTSEVETCLKLGAVGVGLYRTEFLFLRAETPPSEDQQFQVYAEAVRSLQGRPDRHPDDGSGRRQAGVVPRLVLRPVQPRSGAAEPAPLASRPAPVPTAAQGHSPRQALGDVRIMFPLVSSLSEFRQARAVLSDVAAELRAEGHATRENLPVGIMVEVPAAALMADHLAKEVDFFSIGTNDLIQYTLAVDRTNETVAELYSAADPSVLRLIAKIVEAARFSGITVSVCGAMGGDPLFTMLLLGLGLRQLSMPPHQLPEIRRVIRSVRIETAQALAAQVLELETAQAVAAVLTTALRRALADHPASEPRSDGSIRLDTDESIVA